MLHAMAEIFFTVQDCETLVRKCLKSDKIETVDFVVIRLPSQNFLVKITVNHDSEQKILNFFAKSASESPKIIQIFRSFKQTVPQFDLKITPKLYYDKSDLLLFEDLTWQGFQTCNNEFNLTHLQQVLCVLAKLHAGSFAYEEIKSKELQKNYRLEDEYQVEYFNVDFKNEKVRNIIASIVEEENYEKVVSELEKRQLYSKCRKSLCHSKLISENIMFKYENGVPVDCKLINFKSKHYAPPIYDVLQLIFFNTDENLRQNHLDTLIADYYNMLKEELKMYNLYIEDILTFDILHLAFYYALPLIKLERIFYCSQEDKALMDFKEVISCPILTKEDCYVIIKNAIKSTDTDYEFLSFRVTPLDSTNGYLGDYHKLQIKIFHQNEEKIINCFVKRMPQGKSSKGVVEETGCFSKEDFIYKILVPEMHKMGIKIIDECLPKCYFQRFEDLLVFEDLALQNYKILSVYNTFDFHLLSLSIKKLAKFHAASIIFEEEMSKKLERTYRLNEEYGKFLREIFFLKEETHLGARVFQAGVKSIMDVVNLFPEEKTALNQKSLEAALPKLEEIFYTVVKSSKRYRNVLSHGDLWYNNIMVRFDGENYVDCCFVDYQCTRYCPPAHDFLSILHLTTDRDTRLKHAEQLKEIYHKELSQILASYSYDVDEIMPFEEFVETTKYIKPQMVMQTIMYRTFMGTSKEISSLLANEEMTNQVFFGDRKEYLKKMCENSESWRVKIKECVLDLYDLCSSFDITVN